MRRVRVMSLIMTHADHIIDTMTLSVTPPRCVGEQVCYITLMGPLGCCLLGMFWQMMISSATVLCSKHNTRSGALLREADRDSALSSLSASSIRLMYISNKFVVSCQ